MDVRLEPVDIEDRPILDNLYQFYLYDFSEFVGIPVGRFGLFLTGETDGCCTEGWRHPFFIRADGELVGFVIVDRHSEHPTSDQTENEIAQFFVMRSVRRQGIGQRAAILTFEQFPGAWVVKEMGENTGAIAFWRKLIDQYTGGHYTDSPCPEPWYHDGVMQRFDNSE
jgi:predicted acetyltransferase